MVRTTVGVRVDADSTSLLDTLQSIARQAAPEQDLLVIPCGTDPPVAARRDGPDLRVLEDTGPSGGAACLNRLAGSSSSDVLVLLESGCIVGPRWLEHLLRALASSPRAGLAGPSTNLAWNEQAVFPHAMSGADDIARTAAEAERRFGTLARTLAPLYSLADFCYAVTREVFDAIGPADEGYGAGPCWEMDFNVRAARAGYDGLWACASYVWRPPPTGSRRRAEAATFGASRRRYQDKFCGARLRGDKHDYREHCRGDACANFAPRAVSVRAPENPPLVSCIMPTRDRRAFIPEALRGFLAQDYPHLELIVIDDGSDPIADLLPADERIRYFRLDRPMTVGAKRNHACELARGALIAHFDDDDWYPPSRVRQQAAALLEGGADVCGSSVLYFYDRAREQAFVYRYPGVGAPWVAGTTLMYRKTFWEGNRFPDIQVGEDTRFVRASAPAKIVDLRDPTLAVAAVHAGNVSPKETSGAYWASERVDRVRELIAAGSPPPLVSCVMATRNRCSFIPLALSGFRRQTYPHRELVVVDDGDDGAGELLRDLPGVRYLRAERRLSLGAKRNLGCAHARGEVVALWDDDDWYAADRLARQAAPILRGEADLTGLVMRCLFQLPQRRSWAVTPALHRSMFLGDVPGGTLVFRRSIWTDGTRFPDISVAEDAAFLRQAMQRGRRLLRVGEEDGLFVYVRHGANTWRFEEGRFLDTAGWSECAPPADFLAHWLEAYAAAADRHTSAALRVG